MIAKLLKYPGSKWVKHQVLARDKNVRRYLPDTRIFSRHELDRFLDKYPVVFLKPSLGGGGHGVMKITAKPDVYLLQTAAFKRIAINKSQLYLQLQQIIRERSYVLQQGIEMLDIDGRPIDFRVLLLKLDHVWEQMGIMGKWAAKNKFVTNRCRGGSSISLRNALKESLNATDEACEEIEQELKTISQKIAASLNRYFVNIRELGLDMAIDNQQRLWLLEANTRPQYQLFRQHEDKNLYGKINRYLTELRKQ